MLAAAFCASNAEENPVSAKSGADSAAESRLFFGLQPPADRDALRRVRLGEELLADGRASEAAQLLQSVLDAESDRTDADGASLRARAAGALSESIDSAIGRAVRQVLAGDYARQLAGAGDVASLADVVARFPPEWFGPEAAERYADRLANAGHVAEAELGYRVAALVAKRSAVTRRIDAKLDACRQWPKTGRSPETADEAWTRVSAVPDLSGWRRWRAESGEASDATNRRRRDAGSNRDGDLVPADGRAVLVNDQVVAAQGSVVFGVDLKTGKRVWRRTLTADAATRAINRPKGAAWIATDGRLVFVRAPARDRPSTKAADEGGGPFGFGRRRASPRVADRLVALEAAADGRLAWSLPGDRVCEGGGRFLGPPAVSGAWVYALVEGDNQVCLAQIEAASGRLAWRQPLVRLANESVDGSAPEATPTLTDDGILVCPTGRGVVVGVDVTRRRLRWRAYHRPPADRQRSRFGGGWRPVRDFLASARSTSAWRRAMAIAAGDTVVVASPASAEVLALHAASGEPRWRLPSEDGRLMLSVQPNPAQSDDPGSDDATIVILEDERVVGVTFATGDELWRRDFPPGDRLAGQAVAVGGGLFVPLRSGRVARIEPIDAATEATLTTTQLGLSPFEPRTQLGELHWVGEQSTPAALLSVGSRTIERYDATPSDAPGDPVHSALAQVLANPQAAIDELRNQVRGRPADRRVSEALAAAKVAAARVADRRDADSLSKVAAAYDLDRLVAGEEARTLAAVGRLARAERAGDRLALLQAAREVAARGAGDRPLTQPLEVGPGWQVDPQRWAVSRVARAGLGEVGQRGFDASVTALRNGFATPPSPTGGDSTSVRSAAWADRRVRVETRNGSAGAAVKPTPVRPGRRSSRPLVAERLPVVSGERDAASPRNWSLTPRRDNSLMLVGRNANGEVLFATAAQSMRGRRVEPAKLGKPGHRQGAGVLAFMTLNGFAAYAVADGGPGEPIWSTPRPSDAVWDETPRGSPSANAPEAPVAVGPYGVVSILGDAVQCRRLEDGGLVWRRCFAGPVSRVLDHRNRLWVDRGSVGSVVSAWTGELLAGDVAAPAGAWRAFSGGRLLVERQSAAGRVFVSEPFLSAGAPWRVEAGSESQVAITDRRLLVLDANGRLASHRLDAPIDEPQWVATLPEHSREGCHRLVCRERADRLLVLCDRSNPPVDRLKGFGPLGSAQLVSGALHCLAADDGRALWAGSAVLDGVEWVELPVADAPVLLVARRNQPEDEAEPTAITASVLAVSSGAPVWTGTGLPMGDPSATRPWSVSAWIESGFQGDRSPDAPRPQRMHLTLGATELVLATTDEPAPVRPPYIARFDDPDATDAQDARLSVEQLFRAFQDLP